MSIIQAEVLEKRAEQLADKDLNGMKLVLVTLKLSANPIEAELEVYFFNDKELNNLVAATLATAAKDIFPISGGHRVLGGVATGQVQVTQIAAPTSPTNPEHKLILTVKPIGDYSTYTLNLNFANIDPLFDRIPFKFRPGCFSTECVPKQTFKPAPPELAIDYLAKDYDSFVHTMIAAMIQRVPGWQPTSEADLDRVLLEIISVGADELSDYQDRVMNEAYLTSARKRLSLARHGRLMDYHIHQGNQASTWVAMRLKAAISGMPLGFLAWTGEEVNASTAQVFMTQNFYTPDFDPLLNEMELYTWNGAIPSLAAGSVTADLKLEVPSQERAKFLQNLLRRRRVNYLLIQEWLNPATGLTAGRDPTKRQLLKLLPGNKAAKAKQDLFTGDWFVRVEWAERDKLQRNYCFTIDCATSQPTKVSLFHGNLVEVHHGRPRKIVFRAPGTILGTNEYYYQPTRRWGTLCSLPPEPLAYQATLPGGEIPPQSTLEVTIGADPWDEAIDLIHSDDTDEAGDRFIVETDELSQSVIRFGNGTNGSKLPSSATVNCEYQVGFGLDGNIGADTLLHGGLFVSLDAEHQIDANADLLKPTEPGKPSIWNPFDVTNGRAPEPVTEIIRRVPEAYRFGQLRAVTLQDYVRRAEELPEVSKAAARYAWTGSWRTVQIAIDPFGTTMLDDPLREKLARHLNAVRLIGEDLEIRPPRFVPLAIQVKLCIDRAYWSEDVRFLLEQEFSDGFTADGQMGFFHPDLWTFGQELHASQILGRIQAIEGVEHVISITLKRWNEPTPGTDKIANLRPNEIIQVRNDPDHMETGFIKFDLQGGRQ
jgi:hypothetical protein